MSDVVAITRREWRDISRILKDKLKFEALRAGQQEALEALLHGRDTLAVLPTGSGKSAIYQIAALMIPGPTVVVSPLIALQLDQAEAIEDSELGAAAVVNSLQSGAERSAAFEQLELDNLEFILLSPEQLQNPETLARLQSAKPSLFVIDEAHCISEWGHSFRPDYLRLGSVLEALGRPRTLALTATASPEVRKEIVERLGLRDPQIVVTGFDRPNIHLSVRGLTGEDLKQRTLLGLLPELGSPGIIYVGTRRHADELAQAIAGAGHAAVSYHAGLKRADRLARQSAFMSGNAPFIVATSAFGMGIDKPDVRFVVHYHVSDSLDSYYQEIGRAGRDGEPARALLFFSARDLNLKRFFAGGGKLDMSELELLLRLLQGAREPLEAKQLQEQSGLTKSKLARALDRLEDQNLIERDAQGAVALLRATRDLQQEMSSAVDAQMALRENNQRRLDEMHAYARSRDCRRTLLLQHFGERLETPCSGCDNCDLKQGQPSTADAAA